LAQLQLDAVWQYPPSKRPDSGSAVIYQWGGAVCGQLPIDEQLVLRREESGVPGLWTVAVDAQGKLKRALGNLFRGPDAGGVEEVVLEPTLDWDADVVILELIECPQ
jgi:hypothetical protein